MSRKEIKVQDEASTHYEELRYRRSYSLQYHYWEIRKMLSLVSPRSLEGKILDDGCGIGILARLLPNRGKHIVGVDTSAGMLNKAKSRLNEIVLADSQKLPFRDGCFDAVIARSLLHHLPNPDLAIDEIYRILKEGGEAAFADTHLCLLNDLARRILYKSRRFSDEHKNFGERELYEYIGARLSIDKVCYVGYLAYPLIGFPDMIDFFRYVPLTSLFVSLLIKIDEFISTLPIIKTQSWGIIIKATKR